MTATERDIRNATSPPLDYDDVSSAEINVKIRLVETALKHKWFEGGGLPGDADDAVILYVLSYLLSRSDLARKYGTLSEERFADYSYVLAGNISRGSEFQSSPTAIKNTYQDLADCILFNLSAPNRFKVRLTNE